MPELLPKITLGKKYNAVKVYPLKVRQSTKVLRYYCCWFFISMETKSQVLRWRTPGMLLWPMTSGVTT